MDIDIHDDKNSVPNRPVDGAFLEMQLINFPENPMIGEVFNDLKKTLILKIILAMDVRFLSN